VEKWEDTNGGNQKPLIERQTIQWPNDKRRKGQTMIYKPLCIKLKIEQIRVITKLPNTEQSSKGKGKAHRSTNRQNQSTTRKLGKPQWP